MIVRMDSSGIGSWKLMNSRTATKEHTELSRAIENRPMDLSISTPPGTFWSSRHAAGLSSVAHLPRRARLEGRAGSGQCRRHGEQS